MVLNILKQHQFVANGKKCAFGKHQVEYLGHVISKAGVAVDPAKVSSVLQWPVPKNVKGVRGFLGLTGYYRKFIANYGNIAKPLTELTKKDGFRWNVAAAEAFEKLKVAVTTAPVLAMPNFKFPFEIECDASGKGVGAVLLQSKHPIAYFSKAFESSRLSKSAYDKELMALVLAIQHWRHYLLGRRFVVYSDQKSLKHLLQQRITTANQQEWMAKLLGFDFEVVYKAGVENKVADALSRQHEDAEIHALKSYPIWQQSSQLQQEVSKDPWLKSIVEAIQKDVTAKPGFSLKGGILFYKNRLVIPANSPLIEDLLKDFHSSPSGGHSGYLRTYRRMAGTLYWQGMMKRVQDFVKACDTCQRQKYAATTPSGLLQPLPIPVLVWSEISMDFITCLPKSNGFEAILVVVDRLSKYSHFIPLKHPFTARSIAAIFVKEVVRLHGIPESILSDRDPLFVSIFWKELFKLVGTVLKMSSAYHPQTDGQTEVINRCLEAYLRCFIADQPKSWAHWIPWAELWYNTTFHVSTGFTPFEVVYGRRPPVLVHFLEGETRVEAVAQELRDRDEALRQLKANLLKAQEYMKYQADKKRKAVQFEIGDWVFLKLRPHRQQSVVHRIHQKLAPRFFGPYQVIKKIGQVAYKLQLPATSKIHPTFHVSLLKKAVGNYTATTQLPSSLESDTGDIIPAKVLSWRDKFDGGQHKREWLIQWEGMDVGDATWEEELLLKSQFPDLRLEDKATVEGGGDDRNGLGPTSDEGDLLVNRDEVGPKQWQVYVRKNKKGDAEK